MAKYRVVYCGSNEVPVDLIKPILDEIDAEMVIERPKSEADVAEAGRDADGLIFHGSIPFTREIIEQLKRCKVVCRTGVGVDRMDLEAAVERGIVVSNAAGCNAIEVAEQTIGLLIASARKLVRMNQYVHDGRWRRHTTELHAFRGPVSRITGRTPRNRRAWSRGTSGCTPRSRNEVKGPGSGSLSRLEDRPRPWCVSCFLG